MEEPSEVDCTGSYSGFFFMRVKRERGASFKLAVSCERGEVGGGHERGGRGQEQGASEKRCGSLRPWNEKRKTGPSEGTSDAGGPIDG